MSKEQDMACGSTPRQPSTKMAVAPRANGSSIGAANRRLSLSCYQNDSFRSINKDKKRDNTRPVAPVNYVAISKEDNLSQILQ